MELVEDRAEYPMIENIGYPIGDVKSKIMMACRYFNENGYQIFGVALQK